MLHFHTVHRRLLPRRLALPIRTALPLPSPPSPRSLTLKLCSLRKKPSSASNLKLRNPCSTLTLSTAASFPAALHFPSALARTSARTMYSTGCRAVQMRTRRFVNETVAVASPWAGTERGAGGEYAIASPKGVERVKATHADIPKPVPIIVAEAWRVAVAVAAAA